MAADDNEVLGQYDRVTITDISPTPVKYGFPFTINGTCDGTVMNRTFKLYIDNISEDEPVMTMESDDNTFTFEYTSLVPTNQHLSVTIGCEATGRNVIGDVCLISIVRPALCESIMYAYNMLYPIIKNSGADISDVTGFTSLINKLENI